MSSPLSEAKALLVRRWGEMGGYWGINRTMAEIHALLFVSTEPLCTDDIMAQLHISRGNASMNVRGLLDWGLIQRVHKLGDRKEYFEADTNVWHMFETIMRERRRREVEPIIETIERCRGMVQTAGKTEDTAYESQATEFARRLGELQRFLTTMGTLFELVLQFGNEGVESLLALASAASVPENDTPPEPTGTKSASRPARNRTTTRKTRGRKTRS